MDVRICCRNEADPGSRPGVLTYTASIRMNEPPVDGNTTTAGPVVITTSSLLALALTFYALRIYTRIRPTFKLSASDYIISMALLLELVVFTLLMVDIHLGLGRHTYYVSQASQIKLLRLAYVLEFLSYWTLGLARISVAVMLLYFKISNAWRVVLWILIIIQLAMVIGSNIVLLNQCRPIRAMWENVPGAVCWTNNNLRINGYVYAGMAILSDFIFALMPAFFIWRLSRPLIERILISLLMALGIVAAVTGMIKIYYMHTFVLGGDSLRETVPLFMWFRVEELVLIAAACSPFLKAPIERTIARLGGPQFRFLTLGLNTIRSDEGDVSNVSAEVEQIGNRGSGWGFKADAATVEAVLPNATPPMPQGYRGTSATGQ